MIRNIGPVDRAIRIVIGILLLSWLVLGVGPWHWLGLIGVVPLGTALVRWCPLYSVLGVHSRPGTPTREA